MSTGGSWTQKLRSERGTDGDSLEPCAVMDARLLIIVTMARTGCYLFQQPPPTRSYFWTGFISQAHHLHSTVLPHATLDFCASHRNLFFFFF